MNDLEFLPFQTVRQYHFHNVARNENISSGAKNCICLSIEIMLRRLRPLSKHWHSKQKPYIVSQTGKYIERKLCDNMIN